MLTRNKYVQWVWLVALLLTPFVLWLLPADFFDHGEVVMCPSRLFFSFECLGCGMTRAIMHLHHFELTDAIYYNQGSVLIYPFLVFLWLMWSLRTADRLALLKPEWKQQKPVRWFLEKDEKAAKA